MDSVLSQHIATALAKNPYLHTSDLKYEAAQGRVVLKGAVPSYFEKQMAQESLRSVEGIAELLNELVVLGRSLRLDVLDE
ncbi:MAG: BON domain-containing protein [Planctomycetaceae bacterium]|nr:BON domain-containing protein [Planctomycetaceae bacterium]